MTQLPESPDPSFSISSSQQYHNSLQDKPDSLPLYIDSEKASSAPHDQQTQYVKLQKSFNSRAYQRRGTVIISRLFGSILLLVLVWGLNLSSLGTYLLTQVDLISSGHPLRSCSYIGSNNSNNSFSQLPPRRYKRHETSSSITGSFLLFDSLDLATTTGDIDILVTPQQGVDPAVLRLSTDTGTIRVALGSSFSTRTAARLHDNGGSETLDSTVFTLEPSTNDEMFPSSVVSRSFDTSIDSQTGPIQAALLMGNNATTIVRSETGAIALDIITVGVGPNDGPSLLRTMTQTGSQVIQINPLRSVLADQAQDVAITNLEAQHVVHGSGDLKLVYPDEWRGQLEVAVQGEGYIDLVGRNVEIDIRELKYIQAHRGQGKNAMATVLGNGAIVFSCGVNYEQMG